MDIIGSFVVDTIDTPSAVRDNVQLEYVAGRAVNSLL
jgi:hypothetical protein